MKDTTVMVIAYGIVVLVMVGSLYIWGWKLNPYEPSCCTELRQRIEILEKQNGR